jgi:hypothetical protein
MRLEGHEISGCFTLVAVPIAGLIKYINLIGGLEHFLFFHMLGRIIPSD